MRELGGELAAFLEAVLAGMIAVSVYSCIRSFRRAVRHTPAAVNLEDGAYWLWTAGYLFSVCFRTADGVIRWYFAAGAVLGAVLFAGLWRRLERLIGRLPEKRNKNSGKTIEIK